MTVTPTPTSPAAAAVAFPTVDDTLTATATTSPRTTPIPVTCFTGFLGAGKTSTILTLIDSLPSSYRVVLLKNEYGDVDVDSKLVERAQRSKNADGKGGSAVAGVAEITNGCMCCTLVGQIQTALLEIRDTMNPDRIIIESSGSAFPATLAIQIRSLASEGFSLDAVVTVIDCVNFRGYEDSSPTAKIQAKYTDALLLNKHELVSERDLDTVLDHLYELNDETPVIKVGKDQPLTPDLIFGLDSKLFLLGSEEAEDWKKASGDAAVGGGHMDEVETKSVWRGGGRPGAAKASKGKKRAHEAENGNAQQEENDGRHRHAGHAHGDAGVCGCVEDDQKVDEEEQEEESVHAVDLTVLEAELKKLPFEIYRVKGFLRLPSIKSFEQSSTPPPPITTTTTHILNWAFGRHELTPAPELDDSTDLEGVSFRLTVMGERGEVAKRARTLALALGGEVA